MTRHNVYISSTNPSYRTEHLLRRVNFQNATSCQTLCRLIEYIPEKKTLKIKFNDAKC